MDSPLSTATRECIEALGLELKHPVRVDAFADMDAVLVEIATLRTSAVRLIAEADSIVASITSTTGETVRSDKFVEAVRSAVAQRLFVTGLPHRGVVLSLEDLIERVRLRPDEEQITLEPSGEHDSLVDRLAEELGVSLYVKLDKFCEALNRDIDSEQPGSSFVSSIATLASFSIGQASGKIITMLRELNLGEEPQLQVSPNIAGKIRRILILNRRLKTASKK